MVWEMIAVLQLQLAFPLQIPKHLLKTETWQTPSSINSAELGLTARVQRTLKPATV